MATDVPDGCFFFFWLEFDSLNFLFGLALLDFIFLSLDEFDFLDLFNFSFVFFFLRFKLHFLGLGLTFDSFAPNWSKLKLYIYIYTTTF